MKHAILSACWIVVIAAGAFLRFERLAERPFHADEATGARITAQRMEKSGGRFDPSHYHGPLLSVLAAPICRYRGEQGWREMTKLSPRLLPATAGVLMVMAPLLGRRRFGDAPMLLAAALIATSPLLVYYSRMFIHEMLLALAGVAALFFLTKGWRLLVAGLLVGLMYATKETFVISLMAWTGAAICLLWENRARIRASALLDAWKNQRLPVFSACLVALATAAFLYTDAFRHPHGALDAVRTFFVYQTGYGHDKPPGYYLELLILPVKSAGLWWFGVPLAALALCAVALSFHKHAMANDERTCVRFLAWSSLFHFAIYSCIAYKNPWLACFPWAQVCLLAGFALSRPGRRPFAVRALVGVLAVLAVFTQIKQTRAATGRLASDARNPFAYVPTRRDVERLETWLARLRGIAPVGALEPVAVIGSDYWPLPWYLRAFERVGYWTAPPPDLASMPVVLAMPDRSAQVAALLEDTHVALPHGLRPDVPVTLHLHNDIWELWNDPKPQ